MLSGDKLVRQSQLFSPVDPFLKITVYIMCVHVVQPGYFGSLIMSASFEKYHTQVLSVFVFFITFPVCLQCFGHPLALAQMLFLRSALNVSVVGSQSSVGKQREQPSAQMLATCLDICCWSRACCSCSCRGAGDVLAPAGAGVAMACMETAVE